MPVTMKSHGRNSKKTYQNNALSTAFSFPRFFGDRDEISLSDRHH